MTRRDLLNWHIPLTQATRTTQVVSDYVAGTTPTPSTDWDTAVINGGRNSTSEFEIREGAHSLYLWFLEPGDVLQIFLDLGRLAISAFGSPESMIVD